MGAHYGRCSISHGFFSLKIYIGDCSISVPIDLLYSFQQPYSILFQIYLITAPLLEIPNLYKPFGISHHATKNTLVYMYLCICVYESYMLDKFLDVEWLGQRVCIFL